MNYTKEIWEETIAEFPKMWLQDEYVGFQGKHWQLPPRKVLPKPYGKSHPAMWYAAGSPPSYGMAARKGLGVLGFSIQKVSDMEWVLEQYKTAIVNAEPIGDFVNDNVMVTTTAICAPTHAEAIEVAVNGGCTICPRSCSGTTTRSLVPRGSRCGRRRCRSTPRSSWSCSSRRSC